MPMIELTVPAGTLTPEGRESVQRELVWVLITEQPEGTWGAGGQVIKFAELLALADAQRAADA